MKMENKKILKNKKAQTEVISDVFAFIIILVLSAVVIQVSLVTKLFQQPNNIVEEKSQVKQTEDLVNSYVNAKLLEKKMV